MTRPIIITNGVVLTCDALDRCGQYVLLVENGRIRDISDRVDSLVKGKPEAQVIDAKGKLIVPGFVNAHHHGESYLLEEATRGLHFNLWKDDSRLREARAKFTHPTNHDNVTSVYRAAYAAHLKSGTTCVGEFSLPFDEDDFTKMLGAIASTSISTIVSLQNWDQIRQVKDAGVDRARGAVSLGDPEQFTVYSFEQLSKVAKELKAPLLAHIAETKEEVAAVRQHFQRGCIELLNSFNTLRASTVLLHANHITEEEVLMTKNVSGTVVVCPRSTAVKQTGYPALRFLASHNVRLCLGTDWATTDMMEEMRFTHQLPLLVPGLRSFTPSEVLRMGTINGAYALGVSNEMGSIEIGKRADLSFFDCTSIRLPFLESHSSADEWSGLLIDSLSTADITDVMINGVFEYENKKLVSLNEQNIMQEFRNLHDEFLAPIASAHAHPREKSKPNVLPFVPELSQDEEGGFEEGRMPSARTATILDITDRAIDANISSPKPAREPVKPELPKNTRRVFGDDEDP